MLTLVFFPSSLANGNVTWKNEQQLQTFLKQPKIKTRRKEEKHQWDLLGIFFFLHSSLVTCPTPEGRQLFVA